MTTEKRFLVDSYLSMTSYTACSNMTSALYTVKETEVEEKTIQCVVPVGDPKFDADPCCSPSKEWDVACRPRDQVSQHITSWTICAEAAFL